MNVIELFEELEPINNLTLIDALRDFLPIAIRHLKLPGVPKIQLVKHIDKSNVPTFGRFVNDSDTVFVAINMRNPNDIIRTLAHELCHFKQRTEHQLSGGSWHTGSPEENQAHEQAGIMMREFNSQYPQYLRMKPIVLSDNGSTAHIDEVKQRLDAKCWKGKHKEGTKIKGGIRVNSCVPNESVAEGSSTEFQDKLRSSVPKGKGLKNTEFQNIVARKDKKDPHCPTCGLHASDEAKGGKHSKFCKQANEAANAAQQAAIAIAKKKELDEEFNLIESIIEVLAESNQVDAEVIWEDLESLSDDELYVFAVTQEPVNEDWQKVNKKDKTDGMSKKAVSAYRREHPGSKLKTAVTTKPSKLKKGSKASKRRKSYCSRSRGQMKMHNISCQKTPDKAICKARRRWNC